MNEQDPLHSRRDLLASAGMAFAGTVSGLAAPGATAEAASRQPCRREEISLDGAWAFRLDADGSGEARGWHRGELSLLDWATVTVPHTWQVMPGAEEYRGAAWYRRVFAVAEAWSSGAVRIEFEAIFHSASVWVNGRLAGRHLRKGYTAFVLNIGSLLRVGAENVITVRVDNSFDGSMLPRGQSSDWALDGGIYRPVRLLISAPVLIEQLAIDAVPRFSGGAAPYATVEVQATCRNTSADRWRGVLGLRVVEVDTGRCVLEQRHAATVVLAAGATNTISLPAARLADPRLWHFDAPRLYRLELRLSGDGCVTDERSSNFGIRSIELRGTGIYLNGEKVRLMGVERMAGSNPEFGMAEPAQWIAHDHDDLKNLNCVLSRVHWQQDRRVLDYCDCHGILIQSEVPAWGAETFAGTGAQPSAELLQNGLEQLNEMIARDRNHPSIISWGLCNEVDGQNPAAYDFARRLYAEAKRLDPRRLCSYASNSLEKTPVNDVSGLMDFIECNEYFGSWNPGTLDDLRRTLEEIHRAFPDKPIVISEYGYCACVPARPESDASRVTVLVDHSRICRELDYIAGLIFFCYNDYRTHVGDKGVAVTKQRVHGVVDLYGNRKPSYDALRGESSPIEGLSVAGEPGIFAVTLRVRATVPAYRVTGYKLRGVLFGRGDIPLERREADVPALAPGEEATLHLRFSEKDALRIALDVLRPNGFSAYTHEWRP